MKKLSIIVSAIFVMAICSCAKLSGVTVTKDFSINGSYSELEVSNAFDVTVSEEASQITVSADEVLMPEVIVELKGNTLKIYLKPRSKFFNTTNVITNLKAVIPYSPTLKSVDLSGASRFHTPFALESRKVDIDLSGASRFYGDIIADEIGLDLSGASVIESAFSSREIEIDLSGASKATLNGAASSIDLDISGASKVLCDAADGEYALKCDSCKGDVSGASKVSLHCDGTIAVTLSGASKLHFTGTAFTADCNTSGASAVVHDVL